MLKIFKIATLLFLIAPPTAFGRVVVDDRVLDADEGPEESLLLSASQPPPGSNNKNRVLYWQPLHHFPTPAPTTAKPTLSPEEKKAAREKLEKDLKKTGDTVVKAGSEVVKTGSEVVKVVKKSTGKNSRRRMLTALDYEEEDAIFKTCQHEQYDLRLYLETVNNHFDVIAVPSNDDTSNNPTKKGCEKAIDFDDSLTGHRMIQYVDVLKESYIQDDWLKTSFPVGTFTMGSIMAAADSARVVEGEWDAVTNNCATFFLDMARFLRIPITKDMKRFVVNTMVKSPSFIKQVRNSSHAKELVANSGGTTVDDLNLTDSQLMWHLVSFYVNLKAKGVEDLTPTADEEGKDKGL